MINKYFNDSSISIEELSDCSSTKEFELVLDAACSYLGTDTVVAYVMNDVVTSSITDLVDFVGDIDQPSKNIVPLTSTALRDYIADTESKYLLAKVAKNDMKLVYVSVTYGPEYFNPNADHRDLYAVLIDKKDQEKFIAMFDHTSRMTVQPVAADVLPPTESGDALKGIFTSLEGYTYGISLYGSEYMGTVIYLTIRLDGTKDQTTMYSRFDDYSKAYSKFMLITSMIDDNVDVDKFTKYLIDTLEFHIDDVTPCGIPSVANDDYDNSANSNSDDENLLCKV